MNTQIKTAFGLYFLVGLLLAAFGVVYLLRTQFMPYHAVAAGMPWADVPAGFKVVILGLIKAIGGTTLALAVAWYVVLFVPFRQGKNWAIFAMPLLGLLQSAAAFYSMNYVAMRTLAEPPVWAPGVGVLLTLVAFALSLYGTRHNEYSKSLRVG
jgi:hypothetical protein